MVEIGSPKMQNVALSDCRSLGSNQYPSGRFPKVSIGITVEKCPKMGPGARKEDATALPAGGKASSRQGTQETTRTGIVETLEEKRSEADDQKVSAWFSTRSVRLETPTAETVQFYVNRASVLQSENGVHKKLDTVAYGKRREKGGNIERVEKVAFATMQETQLLDKGIDREEPEKMVKCNNEALKIKLWEILGTAPSQNKHTTDSPNLEENKQNSNINRSRESQKGKVARAKLNSPNLLENKEDLYINQSKEYQKHKVAKPKQNSDTIETDSESPNQAMRRPITRSLTRKEAPPKTVHKLPGSISYGKKPLSSSSSDFKLNLEKRNIFTFDEVERKVGSLGRTASGYSNRSNEKLNEQKKAKIEPRRIYFPRSVPEKSFQNNDREQTLLSPDKALPQSKENRGSPLQCQGKKKFLQTSTEVRNDSHHSQRDVGNHFGSPLAQFAETRENTDSPLFKKRTHSWGHESSPPVPRNAFLHEKVACPSAVRKTDPLDDFQSPTLAMDMPPTLLSMPPNEVLCSPVLAQPSKLTQKIYSSKDLDNSGPGSCESDASTESFDDIREIDKLRGKESPLVQEEGTEKQLSLSPMEEQDTESFEAVDFTSKGFGQTVKWFSNAGSPKKSPFTLHHTKKVHSLNDVKLRKANLPSPSPIGTSRTEEIIGSLEFLEQYPEDSLARSVAQLALVLERFRTRMKSQTSKKSSEILSAAADKIRLQLQDVEAQILADVGKFTSTGKSKRKHLESRFQEQQERLRLIHDKFKEEVNQHLLDCRNTLEELEAYHMEFKGSADRQKASHRKLLLQVEEGMEAQINDAETSIAAIHKEFRRNMNGIKRALKEWME